MKVNLVQMSRFLCCICEVLQVLNLQLFLNFGFSGMFSGYRISGNTSRKKDLVVQLPQLIFEGRFVLVPFVFVISFLLWYFMFSPADNLVPLSHSLPIVLQCFQFALEANGKLFMLITLHCSCLIFLSHVSELHNTSPAVKRLLHSLRHGVICLQWIQINSRLLGTYVKPTRLLKSFLISPQVTLSTFASAASFWANTSACAIAEPCHVSEGDCLLFDTVTEGVQLSRYWLQISLVFSKQYLACPCIHCKGVCLFLQTERIIAGPVKILRLRLWEKKKKGGFLAVKLMNMFS